MSQNDQFQNPKSCIDTVKVSELKEAAEKFLVEAEQCSKFELEKHKSIMGFAAMTTALSCVVAMGEALLIKSSVGVPNLSDYDCIKAFCKRMKINDWFLVNQNAIPDADVIIVVLCQVRNSLAHALSLPVEIILSPTKNIYFSDFVTDYPIGIVPSLFVEAVRQTIRDVLDEWPEPNIKLYNPLKVARLPVVVTNNFGSASSQRGSGNS